jgi:hypothetical protein
MVPRRSDFYTTGRHTPEERGREPQTSRSFAMTPVTVTTIVYEYYNLQRAVNLCCRDEHHAPCSQIQAARITLTRPNVRTLLGGQP